VQTRAGRRAIKAVQAVRVCVRIGWKGWIAVSSGTATVGRKGGRGEDRFSKNVYEGCLSAVTGSKIRVVVGGPGKKLRSLMQRRVAERGGPIKKAAPRQWGMQM